jgi:amino acid permease
MLGGHISYRTYFAIAIVVGIITYVMGLTGGDSLVQFFTQIQNNALGNGVSAGITTLFVGPFIFVFSNPLPGAVLAGLAWPLIIVWLVLLFMIIIITAFSSGYNTAATGTDQFN